MKEHVHRWAVPVDRFGLSDFDVISATTANQFHVVVTRREQGVPDEQSVAIGGLLDADLAERIKAF